MIHLQHLTSLHELLAESPSVPATFADVDLEELWLASLAQSFRNGDREMQEEAERICGAVFRAALSERENRTLRAVVQGQASVIRLLQRKLRGRKK